MDDIFLLFFIFIPTFDPHTFLINYLFITFRFNYKEIKAFFYKFMHFTKKS